MTTKIDLINNLLLLERKLVQKRENVEAVIDELENKETRQKVRAEFVTEKAKEVIKFQNMLNNDKKVKEDATNHLVTTMDFIIKSDKLMKEKVWETGDMKQITVYDALKLYLC